ncbi:NUDIX hydrolase [Bacillus sp. HMF5848]|uniref:NUDIX hydrolase n=1 Tax=Bacillus sp. HMF5848 TaxID=2495421 RepID=UPI000F76DFC2|nr:NUDIX hydrolase [Bacillus sp. HMF5848]RSK28424.1 NUDIX hydrolase [Bacillus sp. HMF5848]
MKQQKRGQVWLAVAGLVTNLNGEWLVVKKTYGGLKGKWSLPAGFVDKGETADEAVCREVKEETNIDCVVTGLIGLRTGVIQEEISDNMIVFSLEPKHEIIQVDVNELSEAKFLSKEELLADETTSELLKYMLTLNNLTNKAVHEHLDPGKEFGYTAYKLFM